MAPGRWSASQPPIKHVDDPITPSRVPAGEEVWASPIPPREDASPITDNISTSHDSLSSHGSDSPHGRNPPDNDGRSRQREQASNDGTPAGHDQSRSAERETQAGSAGRSRGIGRPIIADTSGGFGESSSQGGHPSDHGPAKASQPSKTQPNTPALVSSSGQQHSSSKDDRPVTPINPLLSRAPLSPDILSNPFWSPSGSRVRPQSAVSHGANYMYFQKYKYPQPPEPVPESGLMFPMLASTKQDKRNAGSKHEDIEEIEYLLDCCLRLQKCNHELREDHHHMAETIKQLWKSTARDVRTIGEQKKHISMLQQGYEDQEKHVRALRERASQKHFSSGEGSKG